MGGSNLGNQRLSLRADRPRQQIGLASPYSPFFKPRCYFFAAGALLLSVGGCWSDTARSSQTFRPRATQTPGKKFRPHNPMISMHVFCGNDAYLADLASTLFDCHCDDRCYATITGLPAPEPREIGGQGAYPCDARDTRPRNGPDKTLFHLTLHSTFATRSVVISSRAMDP